MKLIVPEGSLLESLLLSIAGLLLVLLGALLAFTYCEWRHESEVHQVTRTSLAVSGQCMELLKEVVPVTLIWARQQSRTLAVVPVSRRDSVMRDSLRERRWVTP